ncbi:GNAT family N-acetyltransferase [Streptomyces sp. NPDC090493]|uniref:GNAT family N-acetyltransferase n=1 Tax=Streptomyces sp. NPDC090493 TaxID=3365964 RepID=UPI003809C0C5
MSVAVGGAQSDSPEPRTSVSAHQITMSRPAAVDDLDHVNEMHARCSLTSRYARYGAARRALTPREWRRLCDQAGGITLVTVPRRDPSSVIAVTCLMRTQSPQLRELGILIEDSWQGRGLGTTLTHHMVAFARTHTLDCQAVTATTGSDNQRMLSILRRLGACISHPSEGNVDALIRVKA